ncbi:MAG: histidine kinase [Saprospiraceae bacterium]|nr:histidine kinase [Saprospiraceae bacterium]
MPLLDWIKKYKLYHIPFWAGYHYVWWSFYSGDPVQVASSIFTSSSIVKYLFYVVLQAVGVYYTLYYLIPKYLEEGKHRIFLIHLLLTILVIAVALVSGYYLSAFLNKVDVYEFYKIDPRSPFSFIRFNTLPSTVSVFTLALSIKLAKNWIVAKQHQQILEKEKLETELKFLKSQFNPHFLFNTINSVFVLIDENPVMATETLSKFSDLLRYQLYECNESKIPSRRELNYIRSYVELQEIRLNDNVIIDSAIATERWDDYVIAPFLLMPLIENAFKHVSHSEQKSNWIKIDIKLIKDFLVLKISNSITKFQGTNMVTDGYQGIGLTNVKRRLELLYPNRHSLEVIEDDASFSAILAIQLEPVAVSQIALA